MKDSIESQIARQAANYVVAVYSGDMSAEQESQFYDWLEQSARHKREYHNQLALFEQAPENFIPKNKNHFWKVLSAVAAMLLVAVLWLQVEQFIPAQATQYASALGEQKTLTLSDGSKLTLNTDSRIAVSFDEQTRKVDLIQGEVFFDVAKDITRPFVIEAGEQTISVLGTAFNVYLQEQTTTVSVTHGLVSVDTQEKGTEPHLLKANMKAAFNNKTAAITQLSANELSSLLSWREGVYKANNTRLDTLVNELNRYRSRKITFTDPSAKQLKVSGVFELNNSDEAVKGLSLILPIKVTLQGGEVRLSMDGAT